MVTATLGDKKCNVDTALTSLPVKPAWRCDIYVTMAESPTSEQSEALSGVNAMTRPPLRTYRGLRRSRQELAVAERRADGAITSSRNSRSHARTDLAVRFAAVIHVKHGDRISVGLEPDPVVAHAKALDALRSLQRLNVAGAGRGEAFDCLKNPSGHHAIQRREFALRGARPKDVRHPL